MSHDSSHSVSSHRPPRPPRISDPSIPVQLDGLQRLATSIPANAPAPADDDGRIELDAVMKSALAAPRVPANDTPVPFPELGPARGAGALTSVKPHRPQKRRFRRPLQAAAALAVGVGVSAALSLFPPADEPLAESARPEPVTPAAPTAEAAPAAPAASSTPTSPAATLVAPTAPAEVQPAEAGEFEWVPSEYREARHHGHEGHVAAASAAREEEAASDTAVETTTVATAEEARETPRQTGASERPANGNGIDALLDRALGGATPAREAEQEAAAPAPAVTGPDRGAVRQALQGLTAQMRECAGSEHGQAQLEVTFHPSGRVQASQVHGVFAGQTAGSCMARAGRSARIPAFEGEASTVRFPYRL